MALAVWIAHNVTECVMTVEGNPRSFISVPIEKRLAYVQPPISDQEQEQLYLSCTDLELWRLKVESRQAVML